MDEAIKVRWIDALLSGDYRQGEGWLRSREKFCFLGVLCDLAAKEGVGQWDQWDGNACLCLFVTDDDYWWATCLPTSVISWAGLSHQRQEKEILGWLVDMNDRGTPFEEIADIIKDKL